MQVDLDGALREPEAPTDFLVGNTLREHQDYLALALGQQEILINCLVSGNWRIFFETAKWRIGAPRPKATPKPMLLEASGSPWARFGSCQELASSGFHAVSRSKSAHTGTWSDGFSQPRT